MYAICFGRAYTSGTRVPNLVGKVILGDVHGYSQSYSCMYPGTPNYTRVVRPIILGWWLLLLLLLLLLLVLLLLLLLCFLTKYHEYLEHCYNKKLLVLHSSIQTAPVLFCVLWSEGARWGWYSK